MNVSKNFGSFSRPNSASLCSKYVLISIIIWKFPLETVKILLRKIPKTGQTLADPNLANEAGMTALSFALQTENQEIVEKLASVTKLMQQITKILFHC